MSRISCSPRSWNLCECKITYNRKSPTRAPATSTYAWMKSTTNGNNENSWDVNFDVNECAWCLGVVLCAKGQNANTWEPKETKIEKVKKKRWESLRNMYETKVKLCYRKNNNAILSEQDKRLRGVRWTVPNGIAHWHSSCFMLDKHFNTK